MRNWDTLRYGAQSLKYTNGENIWNETLTNNRIYVVINSEFILHIRTASGK